MAPAGLLLPLLVVLTLSGCATTTPWTSLLEGEQKNAVETAFMEFAVAQERCRPSWDAEVEIGWSSSVRNLSTSAYCRMLEPAYLKFIVSNPLGQPLRVIATNGTTYRDLNTVGRTIVGGGLRSWAVRHDLPLNLVKGTWLDWIGGRSSAAVAQIDDIRLDSQNRGAWLSIAGADSEVIKEHILFDWENHKIIERILLDEQNRPFATLAYLEWQEIDQCLYPVVTSIDGLPMGGQLSLSFSDIRQSEFVPSDFNVDVPREYLKTWLP
jgi:hypothetical protein